MPDVAKIKKGDLYYITTFFDSSNPTFLVFSDCENNKPLGLIKHNSKDLIEEIVSELNLQNLSKMQYDFIKKENENWYVLDNIYNHDSTYLKFFARYTEHKHNIIPYRENNIIEYFSDYEIVFKMNQMKTKDKKNFLIREKLKDNDGFFHFSEEALFYKKLDKSTNGGYILNGGVDSFLFPLIKNKYSYLKLFPRNVNDFKNYIINEIKLPNWFYNYQLEDLNYEKNNLLSDFKIFYNNFSKYHKNQYKKLSALEKTYHDQVFELSNSYILSLGVVLKKFSTVTLSNILSSNYYSTALKWKCSNQKYKRETKEKKDLEYCKNIFNKLKLLLNIFEENKITKNKLIDEGRIREYKSSFQTPITFPHTKNINGKTIFMLESKEYNSIKDIENSLRESVIRTIVGFLNNFGGELYIGIQEIRKKTGKADYEIIGIEKENIGDADKYIRHLNQWIENTIDYGKQFIADGKIDLTTEELDEKLVCRVNCKPVYPQKIYGSQLVCYRMNKKEEWKIVERVGSSNRTVKDSKDIQNLFMKRLNMND